MKTNQPKKVLITGGAGFAGYFLAKKLALLKKKNIDGETLRMSLQIMIVNRCIALAKVAGYTVVTK